MKHKRLIIASLSLGISVIIGTILIWQYWPTLKTAVSGEKRGVYGRITLEEGDCMPTSGSGSRQCHRSGVSRTVYFYRPALSTEAMTGTHYDGKITPVATTRSDRAGNYQIDLPEGQYSVLVEDAGGPYCNEAPSVACGVMVSGAAQERNLTIDHATH